MKDPGKPELKVIREGQIVINTIQIRMFLYRNDVYFLFECDFLIRRVEKKNGVTEPRQLYGIMMLRDVHRSPIVGRNQKNSFII